MATLEQRVTDLATRIATQSKKLANQINGNLSDLSSLKTTAKGSLLAAINELFDSRMAKTTYDSNNNGKVDNAEVADAAPWGGITGKPSEFPPANHDASKVTTGVFSLDRLPVIPGSRTIVVTSFSALTAQQQADIGEGSLVATSDDGVRYMYSGSGSKTAAASYVTIGDITPLWNSIENKPTTTSGYGITDIGNTDRDFVVVFENGLN